MSEDLKDAIVEEHDKQELESNHGIIDYATSEDLATTWQVFSWAQGTL